MKDEVKNSSEIEKRANRSHKIRREETKKVTQGNRKRQIGSQNKKREESKK